MSADTSRPSLLSMKAPSPPADCQARRRGGAAALRVSVAVRRRGSGLDASTWCVFEVAAPPCREGLVQYGQVEPGLVRPGLACAARRAREAGVWGTAVPRDTAQLLHRRHRLLLRGWRGEGGRIDTCRRRTRPKTCWRASRCTPLSACVAKVRGSVCTRAVSLSRSLLDTSPTLPRPCRQPSATPDTCGTHRMHTGVHEEGQRAGGHEPGGGTPICDEAHGQANHVGIGICAQARGRIQEGVGTRLERRAALDEEDADEAQQRLAHHHRRVPQHGRQHLVEQPLIRPARSSHKALDG